MKFAKSMLMTLSLSLGMAAYGQEDITKVAKAHDLHGSFEVAPLVLLLNAVPNAGALGVAGEVFLTEKMALMAEGSYLSADLPAETRNRLETDLKPQTLDGYTTAVGLQTYATPGASSWYWGGKVGYAESDATWEYRNALVDSDTTAITPALMAGYRWLYNNNLMLRLGGTVGRNYLQTSSFAASPNDAEGREGRNKVEDAARLPVMARVDFLVGYAL